MRSVKLLVAAAIVSAFVAGPVMAADDAMTGAAPTDTTKPAKHHHKKHTGAKHAHKKATAAPASAPAAEPAPAEEAPAQ